MILQADTALYDYTATVTEDAGTPLVEPGDGYAIPPSSAVESVGLECLPEKLDRSRVSRQFAQFASHSSTGTTRFSIM